MIRLFILLLHILATPLAAAQDGAGIISGNAIYTAASGATDDVNNFYDSHSKEDYVDFLWANKTLADQLDAEANRLFADDSYRDTLLNAGVFQDDFDINDRVEDLFNLSEGLNSLNRRSVPYARHFGNGVVSFADLWAGTDQNGTRPNIIASLHGQNVGTIAEAGVALSLAARSYIHSYRGPNNAVPDGWRPVSGVGAQVSTPRGFTTYRTPDGDLVHVSPGGLQYGADPKFGNRVDHVLDHTAPNPYKPVHSVFNAQGDDALDLVDQAWARRGAPDPSDPAAFVVDMGRSVGTAGETSIRIVVRPGTTEVITAYPY